MFCPKCGKETDASGKFCQWCGADIGSTPANPVATPEEDEGPIRGLCRPWQGIMSRLLLIHHHPSLRLVAMTVLCLTRGIQNAYSYFVQHVPVEPLTVEGTIGAMLGSRFLPRYGMVLIIIPWLYLPGLNLPAARQLPGKC